VLDHDIGSGLRERKSRKRRNSEHEKAKSFSGHEIPRRQKPEAILTKLAGEPGDKNLGSNLAPKAVSPKSENNQLFYRPVSEVGEDKSTGILLFSS
jgi:hypothetical protein